MQTRHLTKYALKQYWKSLFPSRLYPMLNILSYYFSSLLKKHNTINNSYKGLCIYFSAECWSFLDPLYLYPSPRHLWSEWSVCTALGPCKQNVVATINSVFFFSFCPGSFSPRRVFPRVMKFAGIQPPKTFRGPPPPPTMKYLAGQRGDFPKLSVGFQNLCLLRGCALQTHERGPPSVRLENK